MGRYCLLIILTLLPAYASAAGMLGRPPRELNPDYSKTVWDSVMEVQSTEDIRKGYYFMSVARYQDAVNAFAKSAVKNPKDPNAFILLGMALYWTGRVDSAVSEYRRALSLDKNNQDAHQLLGIAYGWKGDINAARKEFETADRIGPPRPDVKMNLSSVYAAQGRMEDALDYARKAAVLAPKDALYFYQLGVLTEAVGRDYPAEDAFKKAVKLFARYEDAMLALAAMYEKRGNDKEALAYYKKSVRVKPGDFIARLRYANLLWVTGAAQEARDTVVKAFSITSAEGKGLALNLAYTKVESSSSLSPELQSLKNSLSRLNAGAEVRIEAEINYSPKNEPLREGSERSSLEREMLLAAREAKTARETKSFSRVFILNSASEEERRAQIETAVSSLQTALNSAPEKQSVKMNIKTDVIESAPSSALSAGGAAQNSAYNPRSVGNDMGLWVTGRNWVRFVAEIAPDIENRLEDAREEGGQPAVFDYILQGLAYLTVGKGAEGLQSFDAALALDPSDETALLGKGTALVVAGRESDAAEIYEYILKINPKNKIAKNNLAFINKAKK